MMALVTFLLWAVVEMFVVIRVAAAIGVLPTVTAVVATSVVGLWLMKVEGLGVLRRAGAELERGEVPTNEMINGALIVVGGILMFVPGFVTGVLGLLLLVPPVRAALRPLVRARASRRIESGRTRVRIFSTGFGRGPLAGSEGDRVYEADSRVVSHDPGPVAGSDDRLGLGP